MTPEQHLAVLRFEGDRLASMPADALDAPVPSVEGWTLEAVVRHTGKVHQWVTAVLDAPLDADLGALASGVAGMPKGPDCLPAYREALEGVVASLARRDPDEAVASFTGPADVRFWCRRQAHEVTIHRHDAADAVAAAGGPAPAGIEPVVAGDGIDEWARVFVAVRWQQRFGTFPDSLLGRSFHVHGTDDPAPPDGAEWLLSFDQAGCTVEATHAKGDAALRGPAHDLLLAMWRRRPLASIEVVGDRDAAEAFVDTLRF
jgi:hypothetical protein